MMTWASDVCLQPRKPIISWAAEKVAWSAAQGRFHPFTLPSGDPTWSTVSSSGALWKDMDLVLWVLRRPQRWSESRSTSTTKCLWGKAGVFQTEGEKAGSRETFFAAFWYLKGIIKDMETNFLSGPVAIGQGVMVLKVMSVNLDYIQGRSFLQ